LKKKSCCHAVEIKVKTDSFENFSHFGTPCTWYMMVGLIKR
jgi:hypothetical protein